MGGIRSWNINKLWSVEGKPESQDKTVFGIDSGLCQTHTSGKGSKESRLANWCVRNCTFVLYLAVRRNTQVV